MDLNKVPRIYVTESNMEFVFEKYVPIWDVYSIKLKFEMHILLSEFISPPVSTTWLLQSNQPLQSNYLSSRLVHVYL